jgi:hypothetical protein
MGEENSDSYIDLTSEPPPTNPFMEICLENNNTWGGYQDTKPLLEKHNIGTALLLWKLRFRFMMFNDTFNNISVISWRSILFWKLTMYVFVCKYSGTCLNQTSLESMFVFGYRQAF